jgi:hypothetical protein
MNSKKKIGDIVSVEVTEENYQEALDKGIPPDEMLSVGKHYGVRGGFALRKQISAEEWEQVRCGETVVSIRPDDVLIKLAPDVSEVFTSSEQVNEALRQILREKKAA